MKNQTVVDILLVEDNPRDAELMIRAIKKRHIANPIQVAKDGVEALDFLFCKGAFAGRNILDQPKLILLDLKLPKVSGLEVLQELKSDERTKTIPVVIVTSSREDSDISDAYVLGANSYVVKPLDFDSFMDTMSNLGFYWLMLNELQK